MLTVGLDATPLLGRRTGIGRYVEHLIAGLARDGDLDLTATAFSLRGLGALPATLPPGVRSSTRPFPANLLQRSWMRSDVPPVTWLGLRGQRVVHGTNFVLPPLGRRQVGVLTVHDLAFERTPELVDEVSRRFRVLVPRGIRRAAIVVTPSQATADLVAEHYAVSPDRIAVTPLGVDPAWFDATPDRGDLPSSYLLAYGNIEPRKGLDVILDAARILHSRGIDVPPVVLVGPVGWGPELDRRGLPAGSVITPGWLDTPALRSVVAAATAVVSASRDEGFGMPSLEAMACGTPVLASDLPVTREVLGRHALLTPPGDAEALADGLVAVLDAPRDTAREHAATYTWERCAHLTAAAYRRASA
jgi:glycosyltransferase involved in cell wall biosynthesis